METKKKIIPCLDFKDGRVVKGVSFVNLVDAGDAVENAKLYEKEGADELAFLDISATLEGRKTLAEVVKKVAANITIPLSVGGGIKSVQEAKAILDAGANKISVNSAAVKDPNLIDELVKNFGSQRVIVAIDAKEVNGVWNVFVRGGMTDSGLNAVEWAKEAAKRGAGEILLTSIDRDGAKTGYDIPLTKAISEAGNIPVIASGGAGKKEDFLKALTEGKASSALGASVFHFREIEIEGLKKYLRENGVNI